MDTEEEFLHSVPSDQEETDLLRRGGNSEDNSKEERDKCKENNCKAESKSSCSCEDLTSTSSSPSSRRYNMEAVSVLDSNVMFPHNGIARHVDDDGALPYAVTSSNDTSPQRGKLINEPGNNNNNNNYNASNFIEKPFSQSSSFCKGEEHVFLTTQPTTVENSFDINTKSLCDESCPNSINDSTNFRLDFEGQKCPDDISIPYKFPDGPVPRYVWAEEKREGGYNSDGDITRTRSKSKKLSLEVSLENSKQTPGGSHFIKGHRRVRSGDAFFGSNNNPPAIGSTPNLVDAQHHYSGGVQQADDFRNSPHPRQAPPLNQSVSVDYFGPHGNSIAHGNNQIHEHLCSQSTSFVNLQAAIAEATKEYEQLEDQVEKKLYELNVGLSVQQCTQEDCKEAKKEIETLQQELIAMYNECDHSGVQIPGDPPDVASRRISDIYPVSPTSTPSGLAATTPVYPLSPKKSPVASGGAGQYTAVASGGAGQYSSLPSGGAGQYSTVLSGGHATPPPVTHQPGSSKQGRRNKDHPYENIDYPAIDQLRQQSKIGGGSSPPPLPPRQPMMPMIDSKPANERWRCPQCTFDNLLVHTCEICSTPRPILLRNSIHH